jgi:hypothetical protein
VWLFSLQVLDWIENHGEAFLSKHTGVGKSLHRARALQKRHEDFEEVAQVRERPEYPVARREVCLNKPKAT